MWPCLPWKPIHIGSRLISTSVSISLLIPVRTSAIYAQPKESCYWVSDGAIPRQPGRQIESKMTPKDLRTNASPCVGIVFRCYLSGGSSANTAALGSHQRPQSTSSSGLGWPPGPAWRLILRPLCNAGCATPACVARLKIVLRSLANICPAMWTIQEQMFLSRWGLLFPVRRQITHQFAPAGGIGSCFFARVGNTRPTSTTWRWRWSHKLFAGEPVSRAVSIDAGYIWPTLWYVIMFWLRGVPLQFCCNPWLVRLQLTFWL